MKTHLLLTLLAALATNNAGAVEYSFIVPNKLPGLDGISDLNITGLTNDQQISGIYQLDGQINYFFYDFKDGSRITLQGAKGLTAKGNSLPSNMSSPIWNKYGQAAGAFTDVNNQHGKAFIYADGEYTIIGEPADSSRGILGGYSFNDQGQMVANYDTGTAIAEHPNFFIYSNGSISSEPLPSNIASRQAVKINNSGQVIGNETIYTNAGNPQLPKFLHDNNGFTYFDDPNAVNPQIDINDKGQVYFFYGDSNRVLHMVMYDQGIYTRMDPPQKMNGLGLSVFTNNNGQLAGNYLSDFNASGTPTSGASFIYDKGVYTRLNLPSSISPDLLHAFNDNGQIIGSYYDANMSYRYFLANPLDTFDPATQTLHLNNLQVDGKMYHDVTATIDFSIVSIASSVAKGTIATEVSNPVDTFDPASGMLTLNAVVSGDIQYNHVVAKLKSYRLQQ